ncbi:uncharacterized protein LOC107981735 [Nasonia vitripennis]|uniref:Regulatory protein zeste n=1 Tax=Nasonia vitripennis TaxID=7425 RepID=A0A7M7Q2L0_NASVI|nr:uncharacterized protein LOC107981735 [Nasonia vitripennis]
MTTRRMNNWKKDQFEALIKFMEDNPQLATAKISQYSDLWIEVSTIVNSVPNGVFKDVESLKRSWKDMIINAKAAFTSYMNRTSKTINENYRRILALTKDSTAVDDENDQEEYKQQFPALAKLKAEQSQQPTVQSPMFIDLTSGPSASTGAVRKSCSGTPSISQAGLVVQPTKRQGKSLGNPSGRSTFPNVPPPSVRGSDFINNFNNAGAQHIQKVFKDCLENFGNQLVQNISKMISEELVKAVINMQAAQSSKADDDFEASLPKKGLSTNYLKMLRQK